MSSVSITWGWGSLRTATVWGVHSWLFCACSDIVLRELGVRVGAVWWKLFSMLNLPKANFWEVWTKVSKTLPSFLPPMAAALKSPVASLLPDVASRCGLELFQADKGCRDCSQSGFSSSLVQWGLSNALPPLLPFLH